MPVWPNGILQIKHYVYGEKLTVTVKKLTLSKHFLVILLSLNLNIFIYFLIMLTCLFFPIFLTITIFCNHRKTAPY